MDRKTHWESVFAKNPPSGMSWFRPRLDNSLALIERSGVGKDEAVIDIGAGDSTLVDDLLAAGFQRVSALDISPSALARSRARLGERAGAVHWIEGDVAQARLEASRYGLWHDRAFFHFIVDPAERRTYLTKMGGALKRRGFVVMATFAEDGPTRCSGLPTMRYSPEDLRRELGEGYRLVESVRETHRTPDGREQRFAYCLFRRV